MCLINGPLYASVRSGATLQPPAAQTCTCNGLTLLLTPHPHLSPYPNPTGSMFRIFPYGKEAVKTKPYPLPKVELIPNPKVCSQNPLVLGCVRPHRNFSTSFVYSSARKSKQVPPRKTAFLPRRRFPPRPFLFPFTLFFARFCFRSLSSLSVFCFRSLSSLSVFCFRSLFFARFCFRSLSLLCPLFVSVESSPIRRKLHIPSYLSKVEVISADDGDPLYADNGEAAISTVVGSTSTHVVSSTSSDVVSSSSSYGSSLSKERKARLFFFSNPYRNPNPTPSLSHTITPQPKP
jgi:hypothetical protein